jgi:hypothetical protein
MRNSINILLTLFHIFSCLKKSIQRWNKTFLLQREGHKDMQGHSKIQCQVAFMFYTNASADIASSILSLISMLIAKTAGNLTFGFAIALQVRHLSLSDHRNTIMLHNVRCSFGFISCSGYFILPESYTEISRILGFKCFKGPNSLPVPITVSMI